MSLVIVSTCGTSLFTNGAPRELGDLFREHANARREEDVPVPARERIAARIAEQRGLLEAADHPAARAASAEINGLMAVRAGPVPASARANVGPDAHFFVATDTWLGQSSAELVAAWSKRAHPAATSAAVSVASLRTSTLEDFQAGVAELASWCEQTLRGHRERGYRVLFNLTGGFKGVNGFMHALSALYADEVAYLFEQSAELLRIPTLFQAPPLASLVAPAAVGSYRRLLHRGSLPAAESTGISDALLFRVDQQVVPSAWAEVLRGPIESELYGDTVLDPWSDRVVFSPEFRASCTGLERKRFVQLNQRIDQLCVYAESPEKKFNPPSLDFKSLVGNPVPPATHEADAWRDGDARRLFCTRDGSKIVLLKLGKALH